MRAALGWTVLALVLVDELLAVAAAYVGGCWATTRLLDGSGLGLGAVFVGGVVAVSAVVAVWALFAAPRARYGGRWRRPAAKALVFGLTAVGLWFTDLRPWAVGYLAFSVLVHAAAQLSSVRVLASSMDRGAERSSTKVREGSH